MAENNYMPIEDGPYIKKPCYVEVVQDHFDEDSLNVELSFNFGEGAERPKARLPLLYGTGRVITKWTNGVKSEHKATEKDQREAFGELARIFPAWGEYCKGGHTTQEILYWFEGEGRESVQGTAIEFRVKHSASGFPNAYVNTPRVAKPKVTKASALTRAAAALKAMFGAEMAADAQAGAPGDGTDGDDSAIPF